MGMLEENFIVWGGDISRRQAQVVAQNIHVTQFPCFSAILPVSRDVVRVIGSMSGDMQVDGVIALLTACVGDLENHRSEMMVRQIQRVEDRDLRDQQDREYQEALDHDRRVAEEKRVREEQEREEQRIREEQEREERRQEEERLRQEEEEVRNLEAAKEKFQEQRRQKALTLPAEDPQATARIALRLPQGQRIQRKFQQTATLADVYAWAEVAAHLPENEGKGLEIPDLFILRSSFPSKDLVEKDRTIVDLQLAGTNILLAEIETDE